MDLDPITKNRILGKLETLQEFVYELTPERIWDELQEIIDFVDELE